MDELLLSRLSALASFYVRTAAIGREEAMLFQGGPAGEFSSNIHDLDLEGSDEYTAKGTDADADTSRR